MDTLQIDWSNILDFLGVVALIWVAYLNVTVHQKKFIHELQFKKEFEVYEKLWKLLIKFRNQVASQRPMMGGPLRTDKEAMEKLTKQSWKFYNNVIVEYWNDRPFYSPAVFKIINKVLKVGAKETVQYERMVRYKSEEG